MSETNPLPSFELDESDLPPAPPSDAVKTRARKAFELGPPNRVDPSEIARTTLRPRYDLDEGSQSRVRRVSSLPPLNPPPRKARPSMPDLESEVDALLAHELPPPKPTFVTSHVEALANALETSIPKPGPPSEPSATSLPSMPGSAPVIEILVEDASAPSLPEIAESKPDLEPDDWDKMLDLAGWRAPTLDIPANAVVEFPPLPKLSPEAIDAVRMHTSRPPQPVPSLPVPKPVDLDREYDLLVRKKGQATRRIVWSVMVLVALVATFAALLMMRGVPLESVRAPLRAPLHDVVGIELPLP